MKISDIENYIKEKAGEYGYVPKETKTSGELKGNALYRKYSTNTKFLAFVRLEEPSSQAYADLSFVIFFPEGDDVEYCVVSIGIGTNLFSKDMNLAMLPGTRRAFQKLMGKGCDTTCKLLFTDTENYSEQFYAAAEEKNIIIEERYKKLLPAAALIKLDFDNQNQIPALNAWLAQYAIMRKWNWEGSGKRASIKIDLSNKRAKAVEDYIIAIKGKTKNDIEEVKELLNKDKKYIILQGAPGTGKTRLANIIAADNYESNNVVFIQFHAETTYSDYVEGIEIDPIKSEENKSTVFKFKKGALYEAIEKSVEAKKANKRVLLIIDEINRANLSNVLGPVFYLFEKETDKRVGKISIAGQDYYSLPDNIDVIATMNTADRSLAVVDFALRRRFAWYTLKPQNLVDKLPEGYHFQRRPYERIASLFERYASDEELNLQPGQYYFITKDEEPADNTDLDKVSSQMEDILNYELMPLMKEYFSEGFLVKAKDEFADLYLKWTGKYMYE